MNSIEKKTFKRVSQRIPLEVQEINHVRRFRQIFNSGIDKPFNLRVAGIVFKVGFNEFETIRKAKIAAHKIMLKYGKRNFQIYHKETNICVYSY